MDKGDRLLESLPAIFVSAVLWDSPPPKMSLDCGSQQIYLSFIDLILLLVDGLTAPTGRKGKADTIFTAYSNGQAV